ncbi:MAG: hypothetical protein LAE24_06045 [Candidatus Contendobacter sp.]|jgi:hypothetical protein|nr:hypothetical protein [Candidatus Contendobacter sp.]
MAKEAGSVAGGKGMMVAPSPLNEVKLELGIILAIGGLLLLAQGRVLDSLLLQLLALVSYGLIGLVWIVVRTRRIMAKLSRDQEPCSDGPH